MATLVLVHGSCVGGWIWQRVRGPLQQTGHTVFTPTLTGLGERSHLLRREIDLDTHVQDVVNVLAYEDLHDVVLLGHSYSGMVVTGVAERVPERLARLIYLDASVSTDGQSLYDTAPPVFRQVVEEEAHQRGNGWRWPLPPPEDLDRYLSLTGFTEDDRQWVWSHATDQPLGTYSQPLRVTSPAARALPRTYIRCTLVSGTETPPPENPPWAAPGWEYYELRSGHWPMVTMPRELVDLLTRCLAPGT